MYRISVSRLAKTHTALAVLGARFENDGVIYDYSEDIGDAFMLPNGDILFDLDDKLTYRALLRARCKLVVRQD
jgi:hypothetical protein